MKINDKHLFNFNLYRKLTLLGNNPDKAYASLKRKEKRWIFCLKENACQLNCIGIGKINKKYG